MLGLSFEKLIVIGVIAAVVIGPERLPRYTAKLGELIRNFRDFTTTMKTRTESDLGVPLDTAEWNRQLKQYDPRVIVKDALSGGAAPAATETTQDTAPDALPDAPDPAPDPAPAMRERWIVVGGSSGHPVRRKVLEPVPVEEGAEDAPSELPPADSGELNTAVPGQRCDDAATEIPLVQPSTPV